ncbi:MAG: N-acetylmuramoyl-L-alanine amidase [Desulfovibrionaceae bacterium]|nr:N-acetylmuramoyl-L-alanine amidase [Desulfovibrionaceae bacterium]
MRYVLFGMFFLFFLLGQANAHDYILDPGHSSDKPGALSCSGKYEYLYNEALLKVVYTYLYTRNVFVDVTRNPGEDISLVARAEKAKGKKLFISLHHDSAQKKYIKTVKGKPCSSRVRGFSIFVSGKNKYYKQSLSYAKVLGETLVSSGLKPSTHHGEAIKGENRPLLDARLGIYQFDDLVVLKNADAPALLLESAVIINPDEDTLAQSRNYQNTIAYAIYMTILAGQREQIQNSQTITSQIR